MHILLSARMNGRFSEQFWRTASVKGCAMPALSGYSIQHNGIGQALHKPQGRKPRGCGETIAVAGGVRYGDLTIWREAGGVIEAEELFVVVTDSPDAWRAARAMWVEIGQESGLDAKRRRVVSFRHGLPESEKLATVIADMVKRSSAPGVAPEFGEHAPAFRQQSWSRRSPGR